MLIAFFVALAASAPVRAEGQLAESLSDLLGQERSSLAAAPEARLIAISSPAPERLSAVPSFSRDEAFLGSLPAASGDGEWECLTQALYFEARGESAVGLFAVAEVILNRRDSASFPATVCGVIHQGTGRPYQCQFTFTCDGNSDAIRDQASWVRVGKVARLMLDGAPRELTGGATYYHTRNVRPSWASHFPQTAAIGAHLFYRGAA